MNSEYNVDVVVIGSGPAGYSSAFRCADLGLNTVLVERYSNVGGVCVNVGCIPSKAFLHIAKVIREAADLSHQGVFFNSPVIKIEKLRLWKEKKIKSISSNISLMAKRRNIEVILGLGKFITSSSMRIVSEKKISTVYFKYAIIAVGSKSVKLPYLKYDNPKIWNSTKSLNMEYIPKRLLIIGGGIIGLEMATVYSAIGSQVDIVDSSQVTLPFLDNDIVYTYLKLSKKMFDYKSNTSILNVEDKDSFFIVKMKNRDGKIYVNKYDNILAAVGRFPSTSELNLDLIGVKLDNFGFIKVDDQQRTNIPHIFAIGDVAGKPMLAHKGIYEGHIAAEVISGKNVYFDPKVIPSVAYTDPEIAWVGITEKEAISKNISYEVSIFPWVASGRAIVSNSSSGLTKLIFNKVTKKIIGGVIIGNNAGELLSEITLAIEMGCDAEDIALTIHAHPTLSESICLASQIFQGTVTDIPNLKSKLETN
ncbi:dihydrolipoyl dehydrogenase [Buchnera aphidicola]|uniref:Dihydrolipoyl dehydrogenase n=1 Tax=Buchnera aphidicola (Anoecia oenotherae) TaxID=1241833 RepID=A0A4D6XXW0_9GAMM|nr:dihydrolipoyl dehydrogenase [Buchnera aphidicola]QCI19298.1 dihydrolipoyl dehydrogenase [Buchnera aphidicola (Anoecia oenotherae)]